MSLSRYIAKKFDTTTRSVQNPVTDTVLTSVTQILRNNPDRLAFNVVNLGANNIYIGFDREVSATKGIFIQNSGGSMGVIADDDGELTGYEVFAIAIGGSSVIFVLETEGD